MELVTIDTGYIDYLRKFDNKVCYNKDKIHTRPYIGALFKLKNFLYFAPLTSSGKSQKLKNNPKKESMTFFPIKNCLLGGVNINNMIPVVENVYKVVDMSISKQDNNNEIEYKTILIEQLEFLKSKEKKLRTKANILYNMKIQGKIDGDKNSVVCDFKLLEKMANLYK